MAAEKRRETVRLTVRGMEAEAERIRAHVVRLRLPVSLDVRGGSPGPILQVRSEVSGTVLKLRPRDRVDLTADGLSIRRWGGPHEAVDRRGIVRR